MQPFSAGYRKARSQFARARLLSRREALRRSAAALGALGGSGCFRKGRSSGERSLTVWHPWSGVMGPRFEKVVAEYQRLHPEIRIRTVYVQNDLATNQKFFTAVAAGTPPDVVFVDGPQVASWAQWGALESLSTPVRSAGIQADEYFPPTWRQTVYQDQVWAVTYSADPNFGFVWNKQAFRKAGLDPERPPRTIAELTGLAERLTRVSDGVIQQIGLIPHGQYGPANSMFTWGWVFGGEFYRDAERQITADHPRVVAALEWMTSFTRKYDPSRIQSMQAGFGTAEADPFYSGKLAMKCLHIGGIGDIERYAPELEFGFTYIPAPPEGEQHSSWVGGWCMAIPKGSSNPEDAWEMIRYLCHDPEGTTLVGREQWVLPALRRSPYFEVVRNRRHYGSFVRILEESRHQRPVMPVQAFYMRELQRAVEKAVYGRATPAEALATARRNTQAELDMALAG